MSDNSQTLCKIPLHSMNLTHLILMDGMLTFVINFVRPNIGFYHTSVVMLFRSKTSILCYFLILYKLSVLYHSKFIGK